MFACTLALLVGACPALGATGGVAQELAPLHRTETAAAREIATLLRRSRDLDAPKPKELLEALGALGEDGVGPAIDILLSRSVPPTSAEQAPQELSEPQRELLVGALERWPAAPALARMEFELQQPPSFERAWAALHVWSAVGRPEHLPRGVALAAASWEGKRRIKRLELALTQACERLLRRDPSGHELLRSAYFSAPPELRLALILGVGATRDARASALLADILDRDPEHAPAALAQAQLIPRSFDPAHHAALCNELREQLSASSVNIRTGALRSLGAQRDWRSIESMLELLDAEEPALQASARWALEHATGLTWRSPSAWRTWYLGEARWRDQRLDAVLDRLRSTSIPQLLAALEEGGRHPLYAEQTLPWTLDALNSASERVRLVASETLGRLDSPAAIPALLEALGDESPPVAAAALAALRRLTGLDLPADADVGAWRAALAL